MSTKVELVPGEIGVTRFLLWQEFVLMYFGSDGGLWFYVDAPVVTADCGTARHGGL